MTKLPRIKVCGLATVADVQTALDAGADALGFVHYEPSPRHLDVEQARALAAEVPADVWTVAVVVDCAPDTLRALIAGGGLRAVQLCGDEHPADFANFDVPVLRRVAVDAHALGELERWRDVATGFVLDHPDAPGGTGRSVNLELAAHLARRAACLLAGGVGPDNVAARVGVVQPAGVDASSRLESAPGQKDHAAVRAFVRTARAALAARPGKER